MSTSRASKCRLSEASTAESHAPAFLLIEVWTEERLEGIRGILGSGYELVDFFTDHDAFFRRTDEPERRPV